MNPKYTAFIELKVRDQAIQMAADGSKPLTMNTLFHLVKEHLNAVWPGADWYDVAEVEFTSFFLITPQIAERIN